MNFKITKEWLKKKLDELDAAGVEEVTVIGTELNPVQPQLGGVVAKMVCQTVETSKFAYGTQHKVKLGAICGNNAENKAFTDATPSGECWMNIKDGYPASEWFKPGKKYYVNFTEAPD